MSLCKSTRKECRYTDWEDWIIFLGRKKNWFAYYDFEDFPISFNRFSLFSICFFQLADSAISSLSCRFFQMGTCYETIMCFYQIWQSVTNIFFFSVQIWILNGNKVIWNESQIPIQRDNFYRCTCLWHGQNLIFEAFFKGAIFGK